MEKFNPPSQKMSRRDFLTFLGGVAGSVSLAGCVPAAIAAPAETGAMSAAATSGGAPLSEVGSEVISAEGVAVEDLQEGAGQNIDTCTVDNPDGSKSLFDVTGIQPGGEKALGDTVYCWDSDPNNPRFAVSESPIGGARGVIDVSGLTRQQAEMVLDSSTGGYIR